MTRQQYLENAGLKIVIAIFLSLLLLGSVTAESNANSEDKEGVSDFFKNMLKGTKLVTDLTKEELTGFVVKENSGVFTKIFDWFQGFFKEPGKTLFGKAIGDEEEETEVTTEEATEEATE